MAVAAASRVDGSVPGSGTQDLEITCLLRRELRNMPSLEFANLFLLSLQALPGCLQLVGEEFGSAFGLLLSDLQVFVDEEGGQLACDLLGRRWIVR